MPVKKVTSQYSSFLVGEIPREYLEAAKEAAREHDMYLKDLIISILKDIYTHRKQQKIEKTPEKYSPSSLVNTLVFSKLSVIEFLISNGLKSKKQQVLFLQKTILDLLEDTREEQTVKKKEKKLWKKKIR